MKPPSIESPTVRMSYVRTLLDHLDSHGVDPRTVFDDAEPEAMRQLGDGHRVPMPTWDRWLRRAVDHFEDEALPLKLGMSVKPRHLGLLGFLVMSCGSLGEAIAVLERYEQLLDNMNEAVCVVGQDWARLQWRPLSSLAPPHVIHMALANWVHHGRFLTERLDLACEGHFTCAAPRAGTALDIYRQTFGEVSFEQPVNQLVLPVAFLKLPVVRRDPGVHELLRQQAEAELMELAAHNGPWLHRIEGLLERELGGGQTVSLEALAQALSLAPRTLQSRLNERGVTFRELLDRVRRRLAERHLREAELSLVEVASLLGFADQSSFQHAFKRWTGLSPGEYRRGVLRSAVASR